MSELLKQHDDIDFKVKRFFARIEVNLKSPSWKTFDGEVEEVDVKAVEPEMGSNEAQQLVDLIIRERKSGHKTERTMFIPSEIGMDLLPIKPGDTVVFSESRYVGNPDWRPTPVIKIKDGGKKYVSLLNQWR